MNRLLLPLALIMSSHAYGHTAQVLNSSCPCVSKEGGSCCCTAQGKVCNCAHEYAKTGSVPAQCPCPKTECCTPQKNTAQTTPSTVPMIEIPHGELVDKITILEIKAREIQGTEKLTHIQRELNMLTEILDGIMAHHPQEQEELTQLKNKLADINWQLWQIEDALRLKEENTSFDEEFIALARRVYMLNDARAGAKRHISELLHSSIIEQKSYPIQ